MRIASVLDLPPAVRADAERQLIAQGVGAVVPRGTSDDCSTDKPKGKKASDEFAREQAKADREAAERDLGFQMMAAQLPPFETQFAYFPGRKYTADFVFHAERLLVEVQGGIWRRGGGAHSGGTAIERDIEKHQLAIFRGWALFPVTTDQVWRGEALKLIELALQAKGWKP